MSRPRSRGSTALRVVLASLLVVALGGVAGAVMLDRSLDRQEVGGLSSSDATELPSGDIELDLDLDLDLPDRPGSVRHILVTGLDDRSVLTADEQRELTTGDVPGARTETIMLVRVDPDGEQLDALRFPRDLLVTRCDGTRGRINAAYGIGERNGVGGLTCLVETISSWSGLPIDHIVAVNFRGFVDLVDAVDGVELAIEKPLFDRNAGLDLPAGCVALDGVDALAFVRARGMDSDLGRIDRQQELVAAALDQAVTRQTLTDPARLRSLVTTAQRNLTFDDRMTSRLLLQYGRIAAERGGEDLVTETIPGTVEAGDGPWFLKPDEPAARELFAQFAAEGFPPPAADVADDGIRPDAAMTPAQELERSRDATSRDGDDVAWDGDTDEGSSPDDAPVTCG